MTAREESAIEALAPIQTTMSADGYSLSVTEGEAGALAVRIEAQEGACADCLVPESVMVPMIERLLADAGVPSSGVTVFYPVDVASH